MSGDSTSSSWLELADRHAHPGGHGLPRRRQPRAVGGPPRAPTCRGGRSGRARHAASGLHPDHGLGDAPVLVADLAKTLPQLKIDAREVFGGDIDELLAAGRLDVALAPTTTYAADTQHRGIRREALRVALAEDHALADRDTIELSTLSDQTFEIWPRDMAPGFYDTVVGACRTHGFEPSLDERGAGNTVWGYIARGRGIGLINGSLIKQLPRGVTLVDLAQPQPTLTIDAVWVEHDPSPEVSRALEAATAHATAPPLAVARLAAWRNDVVQIPSRDRRCRADVLPCGHRRAQSAGDLCDGGLRDVPILSSGHRAGDSRSPRQHIS